MTLSAVPAPTSLLAVERLSDRLASILATQIETGKLRPGDRLPTEAQLADAHGVSRSVVREALHQLRLRGLLRSRQGSGAFVQPPSVTQPLVFDSRVLTSPLSVVQVVEVRRALEGEMAALAAERATPAQMRALRTALKALDAATAAGADGVAEDLLFHRKIAEATGNPQFELFIGFIEQYLRDAMRVTRANEARRSDFANAVRAEHADIVKAIADHDSARARRMATRHMQRAVLRLSEGGVTPAVS
ncbi:GntR family transcriptional repressor for pyruvate dehydrogenase complex [Variovorax sp. GrIS 2.14]|uniref:FadR/GntR family transcriptional regulator n=1 Tax=Variovorax sp. GrIS 2.14 TaxID=3071709 RepID=UPI0019908A23|nr:FadR family transcriptional regulator [Variovorax sp.]